MSSIAPPYPTPSSPSRRAGGWVVALTIAMILAATGFALWAVLAR